MKLAGAEFARCGDCPIRFQAVCSRCEPDELNYLEKIKYYRTYEAGTPMVWSGDPMEFVGSMVTGVATLTKTLEDGRTQMVGLLLPSDFLGRPGRSIVRFDVRAITDVTLCCFRRQPFEDLLKSTPNVGRRLLEKTLDELDAAREWMVVLGRKTAREKIASLLLIIAKREAALLLSKAKDGTRFDLPLTREAMADYLGLTLETVSRQISALKRDGLIEIEGNRTVTIPNYKRLLRESEYDAESSILA